MLVVISAIVIGVGLGTEYYKSKEHIEENNTDSYETESLEEQLNCGYLP